MPEFGTPFSRWTDLQVNPNAIGTFSNSIIFYCYLSQTEKPKICVKSLNVACKADISANGERIETLSLSA